MKKLTLIAVMMLPLVAQAMTYYLSSQWVEGGNRFCKYTDGTVLKVGVKLCPLSIEN